MDKLIFLLLDKFDLAKKERYTIQTLDFILWTFLIVITYVKWVREIKFNLEKLTPSLIVGNFILFLSWVLCVLIIYTLIKYLLTKVLPNSKIAIRFFLSNVVPEEYRISMINLYNRKAIRTSKEYLSKVIEFKTSDKIDYSKMDKLLDMLIPLIIKFTLLIGIILNSYNGIPYIVLVLALIICIVILFYLILGESSIQSRKKIYSLIKSVTL